MRSRIEESACNPAFAAMLADETYYESTGGHEFATFRHSVAMGLKALLRPAG